MSFQKLPWVIALVALLLAGVLGWKYQGAQREIREANAKAERERLRAEHLIVEEPMKRAKLEAELADRTKQNTDLAAEVERLKKELHDAKVTHVDHYDTGGLVVDGPGRKKSKPAPVSPRRVPRLVPPAGRHLQRASAEAGFSSSMIPSLILQASAPGQAAAGQQSSPPNATETLVVGGERRAGTAERSLPPPGEKRPILREAPPEEECVLARGDRARIVVDEVKFETDAGNTVVVGAAAVDRLEPEPVARLIHGPFKSELSSSSGLIKKDDGSGRGFGLGPYASFWDGGQSVGAALTFPSLRFLGHALDVTATVGIGPKVQAGALAVARW